MSPHFVVPDFEVVVGDFSGSVENQNAAVGTVVIAGVQFVEGLLASGVPDVCRGSAGEGTYLFCILGHCA